MNNTQVIKWAAISGIFAVILGAFGAHGLKPHLDDYQRLIFEKGVQYQFIHTLALLGTGLAWSAFSTKVEKPWFKYAAISFLLGILLFSGSLYLLATRHLLPVSVDWVGPITPIGGVGFILGWIFVFLGASERT